MAENDFDAIKKVRDFIEKELLTFFSGVYDASEVEKIGDDLTDLYRNNYLDELYLIRYNNTTQTISGYSYNFSKGEMSLKSYNVNMLSPQDYDDDVMLAIKLSEEFHKLDNATKIKEINSLNYLWNFMKKPNIQGNNITQVFSEEVSNIKISRNIHRSDLQISK